MNITEPKFQRILLVDDDLTVRAKVSESLEEDGFEVILAKNGNDGISAYQEYRPDLILVDAVMPILDGFEFCEQLKNLGERITPILMITSLEDNESVDRAFASGATDYITKPINLDSPPARPQSDPAIAFDRKTINRTPASQSGSAIISQPR
jgi:PleD family two-component response regulator